MYLVRPAEDGKGENSRRKPSVQHIRILFKGKFSLTDFEFLDCFLPCFLFSSPTHPVIVLLVLRILRRSINTELITAVRRFIEIVENPYVSQFKSFDRHKVGRDSVAPPKLSRDTPVANTVHPNEPSFFELLGNDFQLTWFYNFYSVCSHFVTLYIPKISKIVL